MLVDLHRGGAELDHMKFCWCTWVTLKLKFVEIKDILHTEDLDIGNLDFVWLVPTSTAEAGTDFQYS